MARMHIYTVRSENGGNAADWHVLRLDRDYRHTATYLVSKGTDVCSGEWCVNRTTCRHRQLVQIFQRANAIDSGKCYDFDKNQWFAPPKASMELM